MSLSKLILKAAVPVPHVEDFHRYLFVGPHPDDIEIGAGATAAKLAAMGKEIRFLVCMDGRFGDEYSGSVTGNELVSLRKCEAQASARYLGVDDVKFLEFCDGGLYDKQELYCAVAREIGLFKPDVVFAPDPCVTSECHSDHLNVGEAARRAACFAPYKGIMDALGAESAKVQAIAFYMTAKPNSYICTKGYVQMQLNSVFKCHLSQFPADCEHGNAIQTYIKLRSVDFGLRSLKGQAEGFRVLGPTQMHCLPEAGL